MLARIAVLFAALLPIIATASEDLPGVSRETLNGIWEGVVGDWSLYRMDIRPSGNSYLAQTDTKDFVILYRLSAMRVSSGHVFLRFERPTKSTIYPSVITLEGRGAANPYTGFGDLRLTLHQLTGDKFSYPLHLTKGTHTRDLADLSRQAERAVPR
jgi:hypothetical protein